MNFFGTWRVLIGNIVTSKLFNELNLQQGPLDCFQLALINLMRIYSYKCVCREQTVLYQKPDFFWHTNFEGKVEMKVVIYDIYIFEAKDSDIR